MRNLCDDANVLHLDCKNVIILVVRLNFNFSRCYHWGELSKGYYGISIIFFTTACESIIILK